MPLGILNILNICVQVVDRQPWLHTLAICLLMMLIQRLAL